MWQAPQQVTHRRCDGRNSRRRDGDVTGDAAGDATAMWRATQHAGDAKAMWQSKQYATQRRCDSRSSMQRKGDVTGDTAQLLLIKTFLKLELNVCYKQQTTFWGHVFKRALQLVIQSWVCKNLYHLNQTHFLTKSSKLQFFFYVVESKPMKLLRVETKPVQFHGLWLNNPHKTRKRKNIAITTFHNRKCWMT